jgi:hypothetical protein
MWMEWLVTILERHTDIRKSSASIPCRCYLPAHPFTMLHGDHFTMRAKTSLRKKDFTYSGLGGFRAHVPAWGGIVTVGWAGCHTWMGRVDEGRLENVHVGIGIRRVGIVGVAGRVGGAAVYKDGTAHA